MKYILMAIFIACIAISCSGQKIVFEDNVDRSDYLKSPVLNYFSSRYDLSIIMYHSGREFTASSSFKAFAMKGNKYYKIDCSVKNLGNSPDDVTVTKKKECSPMEGRFFMDSLKAHQIFNLEKENKRPVCAVYNKKNNRMDTTSVQDYGADIFDVIDKKSYRKNIYHGILFYNETCPNPWVSNIAALISLFDKHW